MSGDDLFLNQPPNAAPVVIPCIGLKILNKDKMHIQFDSEVTGVLLKKYILLKCFMERLRRLPGILTIGL